jgi:outer membrane protein OmpA-like peptidoglycan-associated protein/uncharacterized protein YidB (DUF937 family)
MRQLIEPLVTEVAQKLELGGAARPLLAALTSLMFAPSSGGLSGFLDRFRGAGLGQIVDSWLRPGESRPISAEQVETALGQGEIERIAGAANVTQSTAASAVAAFLPRLVGMLAPNGTLPTRIPTELASWIGSTPSDHGRISDTPTPPQVREEPYRRETTDRVVTTHEDTRATQPSGSRYLWLLPALLAIPLLAWLINSARQTRTEPVPPLPAVSTPAPTESARFTLRNHEPTIEYSGRVGDEGSRQRIVEAIRNAFPGQRVRGSIDVQSDVARPGWIDNLPSLLALLKKPGNEVEIQGTDVRFRGWMDAASGQGLQAQLQQVFPADHTVSITAASIEESSRTATTRSMNALSALQSGFTAQELVDALNLSSINFATGSAQIPAESIPLIESAAEAVMKAPDGTRIEIGGHTDNTGNERENMKLSQARAGSVRSALVKRGADGTMLTAKGYGSTRPRASNATEYGRYRNRRIEYRLLP